MKKISILGSTGSIGKQTLDVVRENRDKFEVVAISANSSIELLLEQIVEFRPKYVTVFEESKALKLKEILPQNIEIEVLTGMEGLKIISSLDEIDVLLTAVVGMIGLVPTLCAIKKGIDIALANKETLVTAGELVMAEAKKYNVNILPVDSEHSAIFQCLNGENNKNIEKIILTASGGPFRGKKKEELLNITKNEALKHPNWSMGRKISIDSSTLMNKGLEVIEARWLFGVKQENIDVVVHPQSIIHSMVQYTDSSIIAQLGCPDMRLPIQYALTYPDRMESSFERMNFAKFNTLTFEEPDLETFPCLKLAYECLKMGGTYSSVLNSANEVLVSEFLEDKIGFYDIPYYIEKTLEVHKSISKPTLEQILETDRWSRAYVENLIKK
ncbi:MULTISPECIES: 1-deoxy-D-xylulose-5-phosphate reductoisomerase [unclassified Clostridioides]|uniref:1-deoxy-D-xylulose-5-phosphate reductoisomerase n=1 Tax=unclassified Clostridioides TaxID=2635829 RepID=UPI001D1159F6|nr:1-deoxy-D-xylulose-5-phosphate reductoisomerase [Clostridioides sp. ZZV14-6153]MCC0720449.1 1-deoxy-D-xylulose-5-phosphate reductoisomerase [Clostridioides sp. ZZV14-6105]MCC0725092.1 1-deoxy-D-xylulose-5-phosphate reductoisomerase [Clostridioides sp. ZZV14-6045]MCC0732859.1 1-deoxy-D-xylulose-5-phosphate reductoisomerase [Clostridioides sp. ZZV14-6048]MCC0733596.1 1-deoxy-D-xylulose-5-phosphate reductoisomerase [Clostridioides sp. ZZV14-6009]MCC0738322.1 1-deoxy-D-xylulose-5-phosphate redu